MGGGSKGLGHCCVDLPPRAWQRRLTMKRLLLPILILVGLAAPVAADVTPDAGSGSAVATAPVVETTTQPAIDTIEGLAAAYKELKAKYEAVKGADDGHPKHLALAALFAVILKVLLDLANAVAKHRYTKQLGWIALGLAVPIALLSKYAAGSTWFEALIFAGAGPGAIVVHELIARFSKPQ